MNATIRLETASTVGAMCRGRFLATSEVVTIPWESDAAIAKRPQNNALCGNSALAVRSAALQG
jgi:hypothetical protein